MSAATAPRKGPAADLLAAIYRAAVPEDSESADSLLLRLFQDEFGDRVEQLGSAPQPPWFRLIQRWRAVRARRLLRSDIAMSLSIHRHIAIGMQAKAQKQADESALVDTPQPRDTRDWGVSFERAIKGYPGYGYMSPPTD